jgi:hypothetical protein
MLRLAEAEVAGTAAAVVVHMSVAVVPISAEGCAAAVPISAEECAAAERISAAARRGTSVAAGSDISAVAADGTSAPGPRRHDWPDARFPMVAEEPAAAERHSAPLAATGPAGAVAAPI